MDEENKDCVHGDPAMLCKKTSKQLDYWNACYGQIIF